MTDLEPDVVPVVGDLGGPVLEFAETGRDDPDFEPNIDIATDPYYGTSLYKSRSDMGQPEPIEQAQPALPVENPSPPVRPANRPFPKSTGLVIEPEALIALYLANNLDDVAFAQDLTRLSFGVVNAMLATMPRPPTMPPPPPLVPWFDQLADLDASEYSSLMNYLMATNNSLAPWYTAVTLSAAVDYALSSVYLDTALKIMSATIPIAPQPVPAAAANTVASNTATESFTHNLSGGGREVVYPSEFALNMDNHVIHAASGYVISSYLLPQYTPGLTRFFPHVDATTAQSFTSNDVQPTPTRATPAYTISSTGALVRDLPNGEIEITYPAEFAPGMNNVIIRGPVNSYGDRPLLNSYLVPRNSTAIVPLSPYLGLNTDLPQPITLDTEQPASSVVGGLLGGGLRTDTSIQQAILDGINHDAANMAVVNAWNTFLSPVPQTQPYPSSSGGRLDLLWGSRLTENNYQDLPQQPVPETHQEVKQLNIRMISYVKPSGEIGYGVVSPWCDDDDCDDCIEEEYYFAQYYLRGDTPNDLSESERYDWEEYVGYQHFMAGGGWTSWTPYVRTATNYGFLSLVAEQPRTDTGTAYASLNAEAHWHWNPSIVEQFNIATYFDPGTLYLPYNSAFSAWNPETGAFWGGNLPPPVTYTLSETGASIRDLPNGSIEITYPAEFAPGMNNVIIRGPENAFGVRPLIGSYLVPEKSPDTFNDINRQADIPTTTTPSNATRTLLNDTHTTPVKPAPSNAVGKQELLNDSVKQATTGPAANTPSTAVRKEELLNDSVKQATTGPATNTPSTALRKEELLNDSVKQATTGPATNTPSNALRKQELLNDSVKQATTGPAASTPSNTLRKQELLNDSIKQATTGPAASTPSNALRKEELLNDTTRQVNAPALPKGETGGTRAISNVPRETSPRQFSNVTSGTKKTFTVPRESGNSFGNSFSSTSGPSGYHSFNSNQGGYPAANGHPGFMSGPSPSGGGMQSTGPTKRQLGGAGMGKF